MKKYKWNSKKYYLQKEERNKLIVEVFGGKCYICERSSIDNMHLHHIIYHEIESNYPKTGNGWSVYKRQKEATEHPERFRLLCKSCHYAVEKIITIHKSKLLTSSNDVLSRLYDCTMIKNIN